MRVLLIPIERTDSNIKTGDWHAAIHRILSRDNNVVGITRPRWGTLKGKRKVFVLLAYWLLSFMHGLVARYDTIYCMNTPSAVIGMWLGAIRGKPFVWDAGNPALFNPGKLQWLMYWMEKKVYARAHSVRMISALYRDMYEGMGMSARAEVIPHVLNFDNVTLAPKKLPKLPKHVLFIGQGNTVSNLWALRYLNSIAKFVKLQGGAEIWATGKLVEGIDNVKFLGYVDDIYKTIHEADLCVAPVWQWVPSAPVPSTRVTDFMACGKCVVTTPYLQDVIPELDNGHNCLIAQNMAQFVGQVVYALEHPMVRARCGNAARNLIQERYTWARAYDGVTRLLT